MSERYTFSVEIYTTALAFAGSYDLPLYRPVADALNSRLHRFVTLRDATVAPLWRPQQAQRVPQLLVDWSSALLVVSVAEPEPPAGFQAPAPPRDTQPMMFFTAAFALRADVAKRSDVELLAMFNELDDDFLPLRNVTLYPLHGGASISHSAVCLNRLHIQGLYAVGAQIAHAPLPAAQLDAPRPAPLSFPAAVESTAATEPADDDAPGAIASQRPQS